MRSWGYEDGGLVKGDFWGGHPTKGNEFIFYPTPLRSFDWKARGGVYMYCGAVEFVCSPSTVRHVPVLLDECMAYLEPSRGGNFADLTFGGGGHSKALLEANLITLC